MIESVLDYRKILMDWVQISFEYREHGRQRTNHGGLHDSFLPSEPYSSNSIWFFFCNIDRWTKRCGMCWTVTLLNDQNVPLVGDGLTVPLVWFKYRPLLSTTIPLQFGRLYRYNIPKVEDGLHAWDVWKWKKRENIAVGSTLESKWDYTYNGDRTSFVINFLIIRLSQ